MKRMILSVMIMLAVCTGCTSILREHREAAAVPIENIRINTIPDGEYEGSYAGGMYRWRENRVRVKVDSGRIVAIDLLYSKEIKASDSVFIHMVKRVMERQSLEIDALTGATLTTRAHLKSVETALKSAEKKTQGVAE